MYFIVVLLIADWQNRQQSVAPAPPSIYTARVPRPQWPGCLLAFAGSLFRSRVEKKLAHLAHRIAGDGSLARPRECFVHIGGFQYPEAADVLLGLCVRPIGDAHRTIRLLPHRLCVADWGNSAGELPDAGSNHFAVERVDLLDHPFGHGGWVEVIGKVTSNQILRHEVSCIGLRVSRFFSFTITSNDRTGIRQGVQEIFQPLLRGFLRIAPDKRGAFNRSMQHHLRTNLVEDGVYDPTETVETFFRSEDRHLASMEGRAVHACDWARLWQATSHHSQAIAAQWRHSSCCSSPFATCTHAC